MFGAIDAQGNEAGMSDEVQQAMAILTVRASDFKPYMTLWLPSWLLILFHEFRISNIAVVNTWLT